ncbi:Histidine kinase [Catalinimonas alkaloidigena]|uniref:Histidine kinase n=1 Tax=Catalinimonas alkaloidigena TaxID=1075417 RepID=A0A1G9U4N4_9BACT|nr:histidine kinase [Catalinimonas alkaloidigena]SDM54812.1 Histidine kinase [Catalinimonas alkaloidigena]
MQEILFRIKQQLSTPFALARRRLILILNGACVLLALGFFSAERLTTGRFVPDPILYWFIIPAVLANLFSFAYNFLIYAPTGAQSPRLQALRSTALPHQELLDQFTSWSSFLPVLAMSFANILGVGNPSRDSLVADFALAHSLIIGTVVVLGRRATAVWTVLVFGTLLWTVFFRLGYHYTFHYLTPAEATHYEKALLEERAWALERQAALEEAGMRDPQANRYFHEWTVFILVSFAAAYFFGGITFDLFNALPQVVRQVEVVIEDSVEMNRRLQEADLKRERAEQEVLKAQLYHLRNQINPHFLHNTLNFIYARALPVSDSLATAVGQLSDLMRYALESDHRSLVTLKQEIDHVENYLQLQSSRFHNLSVQSRYQGDLEKPRLIPLLLTTLVENAFKHGDLQDPAQPLTIDVTAEENGSIHIRVCNKIGTTRTTSGAGGIGLKNLTKRLELIYQEGFSFVSRSQRERYEVQLTLQPLATPFVLIHE